MAIQNTVSNLVSNPNVETRPDAVEQQQGQQQVEGGLTGQTRPQAPPRPSEVAGTVQQQPQMQMQPVEQQRQQPQQQQRMQQRPEQRQEQQRPMRPSSLIKQGETADEAAARGPMPERFAAPVQQPRQDSGYAQPMQPEPATKQPQAQQPEQPVQAPAVEQAQPQQQQTQQRDELRVPVARSRGEAKQAAPTIADDGTVVDDVALSDPEPKRVSKPMRDTSRNVAMARAFTSEAKQRKQRASSAGRRNGRGNGVAGVIVSDPALSLREVSFGTREMLAAYRSEGSMLRDIVAEFAPDASQERMEADDAYAASVIKAAFNDNEIDLLVMKYPTPDEMSSHVRRVRVHDGKEARLHTLAAKMFNADADGDVIQASFNRAEAENAKTAMDFLIGTDNEIKVDDSFFDIKRWGDVGQIEKALRDTFARKNVDAKSVAGLAKAIDAAYRGEPGADRDIMRWCRKIGDSYADAQTRDIVTAGALKAVYDYNSELWAASVMGSISNDYLSFPDTAADGTRVDEWDADLSDGSMPANLYDFLVSIGAPVGQVNRKNTQFRMAAAIAKRIKPDSRVKVGGRAWKSKSDWTAEAEELMAKRMSGLVAHGESRYAGATYMRMRVIKEVGAPRAYESFKDFTDRFVKSYNYYQRIFEESQTVVKTDMTVDVPETHVRPIQYTGRNEDVRQAFKGVYGEFTMESIFGADAPAGWRTSTLNEFIANSREAMLNSPGGTKLSGARGFIASLRDMRTGQARTFDDEFQKALGNHMAGDRTKLFVAFKKSFKNRDFTVEANLLADAMHLLGSDAFSHFGFDHVEAFRSTDIGRRFLEARSADQLGGLVYEMQARYRLDGVFRAKEAQNMQKMDERLDELASVSDTWKAIVSDFRSGGDAIDGVLMNQSMGKAQKDKALNELTKKLVSSKQSKFEVALDLMSNPKGLYAGPKTTADFSRGGLLDDFKASNQLIDASAKERAEDFAKQVSAARNAAGQGDLTSFLGKIADGKFNLFDIETDLYVDAVSSSMEKTFASSEKSQQEDAVSALYMAACHARNGGVFSDLAACDDAFLGKMPLDRFLSWPTGIARILSDPDYSVEVYDGTGSTVLTRESLVGDGDEQAVWDFLEDNPRIAMALRTSAIMPLSSQKGKTYVAARKTLADTIDTAVHDRDDTHRAFVALADHPGFGALLMLMRPLTGAKRAQERESMKRDALALTDAIRDLAYQDGDVTRFVMDEVIGDGLARFRGKEVVSNGDVYEDAEQQLKNHIAKSLAAYAAEVRAMGIPASGNDTDVYLYFDDDASVMAYFDTVQVLSGAKTAISTGVNGAESQRNALLAFVANNVPAPCQAEDAIEVQASDLASDWSSYERMSTSDGTVIDVTTIDGIVASAEDGIVRIVRPEACEETTCACAKHRMHDPSTNLTDETQTSPIARYMLDKRTFGSEALNLKVKTLGDDKTDSISKVALYAKDAMQSARGLEAELQAIFDEEGMPAARRALAEKLLAENERAGYKSLDENDFANVAQAMLRVQQSDDGPRVRVLSIGQLSAIVKERIRSLRRQVGKLTEEEIASEGLKAIEEYAFEETVTVDDIASMVKVPKQSDRRYASVDEYATAEERIAALTEKLERQSGGVHDSAEAARLDQEYRSDYKELNAFLPEGYRLLGVVSRESGLDVTTVVGPRTLWVVKDGASKDDVKQALRMADRIGAAVMFHHGNDAFAEALAETGYSGQEREIGRGRYLVPFFDIKLNGPSTTGDEGAYNTGVHEIAEDEVVRFAEDPHNTEGLTDSDFQPLGDFVDRVKVTDSGRYEVPIRDMFQNILEQNPGAELNVFMPAKVDIEAAIVRDRTEAVPIDLGERMTDAAIERFENAMARYVERFDETDDNGWMQRAKPDDIVGWLVGRANGQEAWHPVRLYDVQRPGNAPDEMSISGYGMQSFDGVLNEGKFSISWEYESGILGNSMKMFESWFAADKLMSRPDLPKNNPYRKLRNGRPLDALVAAASTSGRRLTYQMQQSMATLMAEARLTKSGYNLADHEGTFPNDPELKEALQHGSLRIGDWRRRLAEGDIEFFPDSVGDKGMMDAFANQLAKSAIKAGVNPSDAFASHYDGVPTHHWFRFNVLFDGSVQFQNSLMRFFNFMDETLCPPEIGGDSSNTLFNGKLQMLVPFSTKDGTVVEDWAYVYTGLHFMDRHFSGLSTPGRNPVSDRSVSIDNTLLYGGRSISPDKLDTYLDWALADKPLSLSNTWLLPDTEDVED